MTTVEYDEIGDTFHFHCHDCGRSGRSWDTRRDAGLDADRHDERHDDGTEPPLLDVGGYLACGCHGSQSEHTCKPF